MVNEQQAARHRLRGTMPAMTRDSASDLSQFRVTLFVGPEQVQGKPFTHSTVYNVKKRSWKGGIQVAVELNQTQVDQLSGVVHKAIEELYYSKAERPAAPVAG